MLIISDSPHFCREYMQQFDTKVAESYVYENKGITPIVETLLEKEQIACIWSGESYWEYLVITETAPCSQYDLLIDLSKKHKLAIEFT